MSKGLVRMPYFYFPPAASKISLLKIFKYLFFTKNKAGLESELMHYLGTKDIYCSNSWVGALALFLYELAKQDNRSEVILPRYSCYEFTLAIQIAGLIPVYVDIESNCEIAISEIRSSINRSTLAVIGVNNVGIFSNMESIAALTSGAICFIEDATYTLFGRYKGRKAGTIGDVAILNFSEGKAIPVGGGAVVLNNENYRSIFENCKKWVRLKPHPSNWKGLLELLAYSLGSAIWVYSVYRVLKISLKIDLKEKMSMEILRRNPLNVRNCMNSEDPKGRYDLLNSLTGQISQIKQYAAIGIILDSEYRKAKRSSLAEKYSSILENNKKVRKFNTNGEMYIIRFPILCNEINAEALERYRRLGLSRLYGPDSELNMGSARETNSLLFYNNLLTLPVYEAIDDDHIRKISLALQEIAQ